MRWLDGITNSMDMNLSRVREIVENRGTWDATVQGVTKSWTRLSNFTYLLNTYYHSVTNPIHGREKW